MTTTGISPLRIIATGLVGLHPVGGVAWDYLQYVLGLARLGHDVYYHEDTWSWPYNPVEATNTADPSYSVAYLQGFFERYAPDLGGRWHYRHLHETSYGMSHAAFQEVARTADVFLNVSGACFLPDELSGGCQKVFLDTDPGYNHMMLAERYPWSENVDRWCDLVAEHDQHFTYAENIHGADCTIPHVGYRWKPTRMPVLVDLWQSGAPPADAAWSTVMTWNAFGGPVVYDGVEYGSKDRQFTAIAALPEHVDVPLQLALGGIQAPAERLRRQGWQVIDGPRATRTPADYRDLLTRSRGEVSVAKHIYVATASGWFSCRSACYLAAGRPVVVENTGFDSTIPPGQGLLGFSTPDEAAAGIATIEQDYAAHARAAGELAREYFAAERVLQALLDEL